MNKVENYRKVIRRQLDVNLGIPSIYIFDKKDAFIKVFPELKEEYIKVEKEIEDENCVGCDKNKKANRIIKQLKKLDVKNKDLSVLNFLSKNSIKMLRGEKIADENIKVPKGILEQTEIFKQSLVKNPMRMIRESCEDCLKKHLSQAIVLLRETLQGYSEEGGYLHESFAIAHINEAIDEILNENVNLAKRLDNLVNEFMNNIIDTKELIEQLFYIIPIENRDEILTIGMLAELSDNIITICPEEARTLRGIRLKIMSHKK